MSKQWFDEQGLLLLHERVQQTPSFQRVMADGRVTDEEVVEHGEHLLELLRRLERQLPDEQRELVAEAFTELAVLYAIQQLQDRRHLGLET